MMEAAKAADTRMKGVFEALDSHLQQMRSTGDKVYCVAKNNYDGTATVVTLMIDDVETVKEVIEQMSQIEGVHSVFEF